VAAGNVLLLVAPDAALAIVARALVGIGSGAGFVAGAEYMRSAHTSALLQGFYGGATTAGGGLAVAVVPQLELSLGWRAPYWSALAVAVVIALVLAAAPGGPVAQGSRTRLLADRRLVRLGVFHGATFGLAVVAANWVVPLLERHGQSRGTAAVLGSLLLLAGIVSRPLGGLVADRPAALAAAAAVAGLAAGLPFAAVFAGAQRTRPDAPGAAVGFVNTWAIAAIVAGTPLLGLAFSLPGEGRIGFASLAALWLAAPAAIRPQRRSRR
jgi:nitrate/nitrite transporter NarK